MRVVGVAAVSAACLALGACAGLSRMTTYPQTMSGDAQVRVGNRIFKVWLHRHDETALVQRGIAAGMGQSFVSGLTLQAANFQEPAPYWKAAAQAVLTPLGCKVTDAYSLDNRITWEVRYACEKPIDIGAAVEAHHGEWQHLEVEDPLSHPG